MKEKSSGILLFKRSPLQVFIAKPSGNPVSGWSVPKGKIEKGETLEEAARREFFEEIGIKFEEKLDFLGEVVYSSKAKKKVSCFFAEVKDLAKPNFNWEVSEAGFYSPEKAKELLHKDQSKFIDMLLERVKSES